MKKLIIALILIALVIGGYRFSKTKKVVEEKPKETAFESLKEALTAKIPLKCEVEVEEGKKIVVYIKGEKQKIEGVSYDEKEQGVLLNDGKYVYIWNKEKREGIKYELATLKEEERTEQQKSPEEWVKEYENYKPDCKPALISDATFVPPKDVTLKDLGELFKGLEKKEKDLPSSGISSGEGKVPSQEEIEKIIKEFQEKKQD